MSNSYNEGSIRSLENRDAVRQRPGMYIGGTNKRGYHHLVWEVVDNSVDEAMNGHASQIDVILHEDGKTISIEDDGRGIPVGEHPEKGVSTLEVVFTVLHAGGKFDSKSYKSAGGLHGVGASVVMFLSQGMEARVWRDGKEWVQKYDNGRPENEVQEVGEVKSYRTGTRVTFTPDPDIFGDDLSFDPELIRNRLEVKTYLNKGLRITFTDKTEDDPEKEVYQHDEGLQEYLTSMVESSENPPIHEDPLTIEKDDLEEGIRVDVAFQWTEAPNEEIKSYVNTIPTKNGGTHVNGFRSGITKALRSYFDVHDSIPKRLKIKSEDIREGLTSVVSVFVEGDIQFQSQMKTRLNDSKVRNVLSNSVYQEFEQWLHKNQSTAKDITKRIIQAAKARRANRSASKKVKRKKPASKQLTLPGKLADCTGTDPLDSELFIVEGDSAGGNAKQARNRETQAVLPLRGKVLNTESATMKRILKNNEIMNIVEALGCGLGDEFDFDDLRYNKVILLMDADSDGHHITTLLLTFFYRYMPNLIEEGCLYIAQTPLYKITTSGGTIQWALDDREKNQILSNTSNADVSRFKGLGEMEMEALKETSLDPSTRRLVEVEVPDANEADQTIKTLMGRKSKKRYEFIMDNYNVADLDI